MTSITETLRSLEETISTTQGPQSDYLRRVLSNEKQLDAIDPRESLHLALPGNVHLAENQQKLTDSDIEVLVTILKGNTYVTSLDLRYNRITDTGAKLLAQAIKETSALKHINLNGNDIEEAGAKALAESLQDNETVRELRLKSNKIGNAGGMAFAQMLQVNVALEKLDLSDTDLKTESIIALSTVLRSNTTLKFLYINRPLLFTHQEESTVHFAKMLKVNSTLQGLSMVKYDMRDFGVGQIAENILENMSLTHLDLSCNRITRDGMQLLARVLQNNTAITHLDLSNNRLECPGAKFLADAIAHANTNLVCVSVRHNNIKGKGLCHLADAMKYNTHLNQLFIWGNVLEESACIAIKQLLDVGRFQEDDLDVKPYVVDDVTHLCELNTAPHRFDYWKPVHGGDIPHKLV